VVLDIWRGDPMVESPDFDRFFRAEHPKLVACALAMTGDRETARDVAQEALLRACVVAQR
jgi:DNA-directed RNA polymerase specialized sigma24 family protein